jgi:hypothetical protein
MSVAEAFAAARTGSADTGRETRRFAGAAWV